VSQEIQIQEISTFEITKHLLPTIIEKIENAQSEFLRIFDDINDFSVSMYAIMLKNSIKSLKSIYATMDIYFDLASLRCIQIKLKSVYEFVNSRKNHDIECPIFVLGNQFGEEQTRIESIVMMNS
jgi:hypothetical protein